MQLLDLLVENNQNRIEYLTQLLYRANITPEQYEKISKEIELLKKLDDRFNKNKIKITNTVNNIYAAGLKFAEELSPNISKLNLGTIIADELKHEAKKKWKFNPSGPNVEQFKLGVCKKLFNQPTHPDSIPKQWMSLPWKIKEKLFVYGWSPTSLSLSQLSKKQATEWLTSIAINKKFGGEEWRTWWQSPLLWITRYVNLKTYVPRSKLIADWIAYQDQKNKKIFDEERTQHLPDGRAIKFTFVDIIDEIQDEDLNAGIKTNVIRAFQSASNRRSNDYLKKLEQQQINFPPNPFKLHPSMEYLNTPRKLSNEGNEMQHCVGGYAPLAIKGKIFIFAVKTEEGRSTVEVAADGSVRQHRGILNSRPPKKNQKIVDNWAFKKNS